MISILQTWERKACLLKIWINNGTVLDPATGRKGKYNVLIEDGVIVKFTHKLETEYESGTFVFDAEGKWVMPGFVDLHVHFREPGMAYKETVKTGSKAAANGGFTSVCTMPNTMPSIDCAELVNQLKEMIEEDTCVHVYPIGAITKGQSGEYLAELKEMKDAGVVAFSEDGKSVMNANLCRKALQQAKELSLPVFAHCEDRTMVNKGVMNEGERAKQLNLPGISNSTEDIIVARDILLTKEAGAKLHLCHCSTKGSVEMVKMAKLAGVNVTAETCPHYFTLCDEDIPGDDSNYKMNPPLRSKEDRDALREALKSGIIDAIATDHAPHSEDEKHGSMLKTPFGIVGLETAFALAYTELVEPGYLKPMQLVERMSYTPAMIAGLNCGTLAKGSVADVIVADVDEEYEIDVESFESKGRNTPFGGRKVKGKILTTIVEGKIVKGIDSYDKFTG